MIRKKTFTISRFPIEKDSTNNIFRANHFSVSFSDETTQFIDNTLIFIDGYVLPKFQIDPEFQELANHELISKLILKFPDSWFKKVKGVFVIVVANKDNFEIISDHIGLKSFYYKKTENEFVISNDFYQCLPQISNINTVSFAQRALFNREIGSSTFDKTINKSVGGIHIENDGQFLKVINYWDPDHLQQPLRKDLKIPHFTNLIVKQVSQIKTLLNPEEFCITLTGGKDSRTALSALLNQGIKPFGFTYGNPNSKDAIYANQVAKKVNIKHEVFNPPGSIDWLDNFYKKISNHQHPWINVHRAHRLFSFEKISHKIGANTAYFAGYMGGELLMGIYYDDLVFTRFLTNKWNNKSTAHINEYLKDTFLKKESIDLNELEKHIESIRTLNKNKSLYEKEFYGLFEIGAAHHSQDITLASEHLKYPIPFFLDIDFLTDLFQSKYQFKYTDNKTKNLFKRYKLYKFNIEIQHALYSNLDSIPFAKKGNYTVKDYRKGVIYWTMVKSWRYFFNKENRFPPAYKYNADYYKFILSKLTDILNDTENTIHKYYDLKRAVEHLKNEDLIRPEKGWHRYTNIIMTYYQLTKYK